MVLLRVFVFVNLENVYLQDSEIEETSNLNAPESPSMSDVDDGEEVVSPKMKVVAHNKNFTVWVEEFILAHLKFIENYLTFPRKLRATHCYLFLLLQDFGISKNLSERLEGMSAELLSPVVSSR